MEHLDKNHINTECWNERLYNNNKFHNFNIIEMVTKYIYNVSYITLKKEKKNEIVKR